MTTRTPIPAASHPACASPKCDYLTHDSEAPKRGWRGTADAFTAVGMTAPDHARALIVVTETYAPLDDESDCEPEKLDTSWDVYHGATPAYAAQVLARWGMRASAYNSSADGTGFASVDAYIHPHTGTREEVRAWLAGYSPLTMRAIAASVDAS